MSYWDFSDIDSAVINSTDDIKEIIKVASDELKKHTKGKITTRFGVGKNLADVVGECSSVSELFNNWEIESENGDENKDKLIDAKEIYGKKRYGFELRNKTYKFRIFELILFPTYPITLKPDDDIFDDEKEFFLSLDANINGKYIKINSKEDFEACFEKVINSRKVKYIISKMMKQ